MPDRCTIRIARGESHVVGKDFNGTTVNECYDVFPTAGKTLLENEKNEIYFRNFEIRPLQADQDDASK